MVAVGIIPMGRTVVLCGTDWVLAYLATIAIFSAGSVPLAIVAIAIVLAKLVPWLRSPWPWLGSAVLLSALAAASVALASRHPVLSDPGLCSL